MKNKNVLKIIGLSCFMLITQAQAIQLTVSIPPLAGLLKPLLDDSDELIVLLKPGVSPHGFQLKPSHLSTIQQSDAIFSIGTPVDAWIDKTLTRVDQPVLKMSNLKGLHTLPIRNGGLWLQSENSTKNTTEGSTNRLLTEAEHGSLEAHTHELGTENRAYQTKKQRWHYDGHIWLSIKNARRFVEEAAEIIKKLKPDQRDNIEQNKQAWLKKLAQLDQRLALTLTPIKDRPFVVLHDAYQYFENHYQLNGIGSVRLNPEIAPSLKRIQQLREHIQKNSIACIFKEPQFPEKRVLAVVRGLDVKVGSLDPIGSFIPNNHAKTVQDGFLPYTTLLEGLAHSMANCLTPKTKR